LYHRPASRFVADFIGSPSMNFLTVSLESGKARYGDVAVALPATAAQMPAEAVMGVRPEHLGIAPAKGASADAGLRAGSSGQVAGRIDGSVAVKETLGGETILYVDTVRGDRVTVKLDGETEIARGDAVRIAIPVERIHLFGADGTTLTDAEPVR